VNKSAGDIERFVMATPKVELHLHLEGAIPLETLLSLIQRKGGEPSIKTVEDLRKKLVYQDFKHFLAIWAWKHTFITEEEDFEEIVYQVLADLSRQNVKYVEAFYSPMPMVSRRWGLSVKLITDCLIRGKERAYRDFGIRSELILDLVRDYGPEKGMQLLTELTPYVGKGIIGIGIGGMSRNTLPNCSYLCTKKPKNVVSDLLLTLVKLRGLIPYGLLLKNCMLSVSDTECGLMRIQHSCLYWESG